MQNQWYIARDGKQYGPVSDADLEQLVRNRELLDGDFLWRHGFDNWLPAAQVPEVRLLANKGAGPVGDTGVKPPQGQWGPQGQGMEPEMAGQRYRQAEMRSDPKIDAAQASLHAERASASQADELNRFEGKRDELRRSMAQQTVGEPQQGAGIEDVAAEPFGHRSDHDVMTDQGAMRNGYGSEPDFADVQDLVEDKDADFSASLEPAPRGQDPLHSSVEINNPAMSVKQSGYQPETGYGREGARDTGLSDREGVSSFRLSWPLGLGIAAAFILVLVVGATFALPFIVPPETIKRQISAAIKAQSGRDVSFKGKMSYRFLPSFGLDLNNIVIHNPPEIKGPDFISIGRLQANLKLLPLLGKRVEIDQVILHRPEITLIQDGAGRTNYEFKSTRLKRSVVKPFRVAQQETIDTGDIIQQTLERLEREAEEEANAQDSKTEKDQPDTGVDPKGPDVAADSKGPAKAGQIQVGEIEIINGMLKLVDQKAASETELKAINLKIQAPSAEKDVTADGTVRFREDRIEIKGVVSTLGKLLEGEPAKTSIKARSERFEGAFDGEVRTIKGLEYLGNTNIQTFSLKNLLAWFDVDVPNQGYGGAYVRGKLLGNSKTTMLKNATFKIDQSTLIGDFRVQTGGTRPKIEAVLKTDYIDLNPYLGQKTSIKRGSLPFGRKSAVAAWSSQKIDLAFLNVFDGAFQIDAGQIKALNHSVQNSRLNAKISSGVITAQLPKFELYGGTGTLALQLNGSAAQPTLKSRGELKAVKIKPLLVNSAGLEFLSGAANINFEVASAGASQKDLIGRLSGNGKVEVLDGAIEGINIAGALRQLQKGDLSKLGGAPSEKTDFSELSGSFTIEQGMLKNEDLAMKGPLVRMNGNGVVNLPGESIDYTLLPKVVASLRGQGGDSDLKGLQIPMRVKGPWAKPKISPDAKGLLDGANKEAIKDTVKKVEKAVKDLKKKKISGDEMKDLLDGMINGDGENGNILDGVLQ